MPTLSGGTAGGPRPVHPRSRDLSHLRAGLALLPWNWAFRPTRDAAPCAAAAGRSPNEPDRRRRPIPSRRRSSRSAPRCGCWARSWPSPPWRWPDARPPSSSDTFEMMTYPLDQSGWSWSWAVGGAMGTLGQITTRHMGVQFLSQPRAFHRGGRTCGSSPSRWPRSRWSSRWSSPRRSGRWSLPRCFWASALTRWKVLAGVLGFHRGPDRRAARRAAGVHRRWWRRPRRRVFFAGTAGGGS